MRRVWRGPMPSKPKREHFRLCFGCRKPMYLSVDGFRCLACKFVWWRRCAKGHFSPATLERRMLASLKRVRGAAASSVALTTCCDKRSAKIKGRQARPPKQEPESWESILAHQPR